jgi:hypothetical protein
VRAQAFEREARPVNQKATVFRDLLSRGDAQLMFDARRPGVVVPDDMVNNACMRLLFALNREIKNFVVDDEKGVSAELRFRSPAGIVEELRVSIPWSAVYGIVDDQGRLAAFASDVPSDVQLSGRKLEPEAAAAVLPAAGGKTIEIDLGNQRRI